MRFIGCKENLLDFIEEFINQKNINGHVFCDLFSGTSSVGKHFKKCGYKIISSDILYFSYVLQKTYIETNKYPQFNKLIKNLDFAPTKESLFEHEQNNATNIVKYLNQLDGIKGFIYNNYCPDGTVDQPCTRKYFLGKNAEKIDAIREAIANWQANCLINEEEYYFLLTALIEAVPFVANISGTYSAFLKNWDKRAFKDITLTVPKIIKSAEKHEVYMGDGVEILGKINKVDILYLDPPYNERQYSPNYHILETIAKWDKPTIKGVTGMRPYENQKSKFCNCKTGAEALKAIIKSKNFNHLLLSYSDEGIIDKNEIIEIFDGAGKLNIEEKDYQRYKSNSNGIKKKQVTEKIYHLKKITTENKLNDLNGSEWVFFLNSVEKTNYSTHGRDGFAHYLRKIHPSPKPPQLMQKFIDFFTKESQLVLDPFMGVGGTLLACSLSNRKGIGIDLSEKYVDTYKNVCKKLDIKEQTSIIGDSFEIESILPDDMVIDFILTDPPYGEMLSKKKTGDQKKKTGVAVATPFTNEVNDLGNMEREKFLEGLKTIIEKSVKYLRPRGYVAVFVKDLQPNKKLHNMLHFSVTEKLLEIPDLTFRGYKIWYDTTQKLYPFGYPHAFVSNQFHQFIMIFRKENE